MRFRREHRLAIAVERETAVTAQPSIIRKKTHSTRGDRTQDGKVAK